MKHVVDLLLTNGVLNVQNIMCAHHIRDVAYGSIGAFNHKALNEKNC